VARNVTVLELGEEPKSPLDLVLGSRRRDTKNKQVVRVRVRDGVTYGKLLVDKKHSKNTGKGKAYRCLCKCGGETYLIPAEIRKAQVLGAGCMHLNCSASPLELMVKYNPTLALQVQLKALLIENPGQVVNEWGGLAYEGTAASLDEGLANMIEQVWPLVDREAREWWMYRVNAALPYAAFNIVMRDEPGFNFLGKKGPTFIHFGGDDYTVDEVAKMFDLPLPLVKKLRREIFSDESLMKVVKQRGCL